MGLGVRGELGFGFEGSIAVDRWCKGCLAELAFADVVATEMTESLGRLTMIVAAGSSIEKRVGSCVVGRAIFPERGFSRLLWDGACNRSRRDACGENKGIWTRGSGAT
jgi:hypothetical protein